MSTGQDACGSSGSSGSAAVARPIITATMAADLQALKPELSALCRRYRVRRLDVFGSAATGTAHAGSDIDLLVEFEPMKEGYADAYFGLLSALQSLLRKPVDLVVDSAIRNPYFRQSVEASRAPLYAA